MRGHGMHIDEYAFGRMVVDGKTYRKDLILLPEGIREDWWRDEGHSLSKADLTDVFEAKGVGELVAERTGRGWTVSPFS